MNTCDCLRQRSIPNYKPMEYIFINDATDIIRNHSQYDSDKHVISIYEQVWSYSPIITITMESYKCTYTFQYSKTPFNLFTDWLNEAFNYFDKMEEDDDIF